MSPKLLDQVLCRVPRAVNENVLVGFDTADDAGVFRLTPDCALVQTVDFFTPIVDDPETYGAIAAANSLSDVYAMGGTPVSALSIVAFPSKGEIDDLAEILTGGAKKVQEAGCALIGGHSINDDEMKFGYAITGTVHPERVLTNAGARPGDALVFTKQLGTGIIATALKRGLARQDHVQASIDSMLTLNRAACQAMLELEVHGCTDVTGFGFIGHAREMARASNVTLEINSTAMQFLPGAVDYVKQGAIPGGLNNNRAFSEADVAVDGVAEELMHLLYDPQTSGGLLIALPESDATALEEKLDTAYRVGRVTPKQSQSIRIL
ncbi:MAG: selenide, water dikinase SelD [bacterium]|nr:selenide, water dikinase SelD [bacterium]